MCSAKDMNASKLHCLGLSLWDTLSTCGHGANGVLAFKGEEEKNKGHYLRRAYSASRWGGENAALKPHFHFGMFSVFVRVTPHVIYDDSYLAMGLVKNMRDTIIGTSQAGSTT